MAHAATTVSAVMRRESNQSSRSPQSRVSCRHPKPITIRTSPSTSTRPGFFVYGESDTKALAMRKPKRPMGKLM